MVSGTPVSFGAEMADYTAPKTIVPGAEALASDWNTYIRDNTININDRVAAIEDGIDASLINSGTLSGDRLPAGVALPVVTTSSSATVTFDFSTGNELIRSTRQGSLSVGGSNYSPGVSKTIIWNGGSSAQTISFPTEWVFVSFKPTSLAANKRGVLSVVCYGTAAADVTAAWAVQA